MAEQLTLMDFIRELLGLEGQDKAIELRDYFQNEPEKALQEYGLGHLSPEDVEDAIVLFQDNDTVSFDRHYDTGSNWIAAGSDGGSIDWGKVHAASASNEWHVREHVTDHHVVNNIDDRDTILDQSVNQNIDTGGGDFDQNIENNSVNATGDGAVAAGGDIDGSTITTGDGNVVGDGNQVVSGDDNTTAFGSGDAVSGVSVDDGSALSTDGDAGVNNSVNNSGNTDNSEDNDFTATIGSDNVYTDTSVDNSDQDNDLADVDGDIDVDLAL